MVITLAQGVRLPPFFAYMTMQAPGKVLRNCCALILLVAGIIEVLAQGSGRTTVQELLARSRAYQASDSAGAALRAADEARALAGSSNGDLAEAELQLARVHSDMGAYDKVLEHGLEAMRLTDGAHRSTAYYEAWNTIGLAHYRLNHREDAWRAFTGVLAELGPDGDARTRSFALNNLGMLEHATGRTDSALVHYQLSLALKFALGDTTAAARTLNNLGTVLADMEEPDSALKYYRWSYRLKVMHGDRTGRAFTLGNIGELFGRTGQLDSARIYLERAKSIADSSGSPAVQVDILHNLAELYKAQGDLARAVEMKEAYIATNAKLLNERYDRRVADLQVGYDLERKNLAIAALEEEARVKRTRLILVSTLAIALVAVVVLLVLAVRARARTLRHKQEAFNRQQELDALRLRAAESENTRLGTEVDHKSRELASMATHALQKNQLLTGLLTKLDEEKKKSGDPALLLRILRKSIKENIDLDADWEQFKLHFVEVHPRFFEALQRQAPGLSKTDLRHCAYMRMDLSTKEIARLLSIEPSSVQIARVRLKKKLELDREVDLKDFVRNLSM